MGLKHLFGRGGLSICTPNFITKVLVGVTGNWLKHLLDTTVYSRQGLMFLGEVVKHACHSCRMFI